MKHVDPIATAEVQSELDKIESLVTTAARLMNDGRMIDLNALSKRTDDTCAALIALPATESKALLPKLEIILKRLDELTGQLSKRFGDLPNLQDKAKPEAAASAYGRLQDTGR